MDENGNIKPEWLALIKAFPDRFFFGSDEFFLTPQMRMKRHPSTGSMEATVAFLKALPPDLSRKVGHENAKRIYKLK